MAPVIAWRAKSASLPGPVTFLDHPLARRVRQFGALRLLRRLHRVSHRLPVKLRAVERAKVLVVAPHMDDDVIGPGGTLALHRRAESPIHVVFCAAGKTPEEDQQRRSEARAAAEFMGFERVEWLGFPEGQLSPNEGALASALEKLLIELTPQQIFCPYVADHHR